MILTDWRSSAPYCVLVGGAFAALFVGTCAEWREVSQVGRIDLADGWHIVAAAEVEAPPEAVSAAGFDTTAWTPASVPATVMAALVASGEIVDPYFDRNLEKVPAERFAGPWWYRTEFELEAAPGPGARLAFRGVNYSAEVWLNGEKVAGRSDVLGAFRMFDLEVSERLTRGANTLAVLVFPPEPGDPTIGFVDWNPTAPDKHMGLWRPVELRLTGGVTLDDVFVRSDVDLGTLERASLTVTGTLRNHSDGQVRAVVRGVIGNGIEIELEEVLEARSEKRFSFSPKRFPQLTLEKPRLWWPNGMGEPNLYELDLDVSVDGRVSDGQNVTFGVRHVADYLNEQGHRGYRINGKEVLIRGGGWVDDMLLADTEQKIEDQLRYVKHMNLNAIRLEGFWGSSQALYDIADRLGIMVMVGWSCQWEWESYFGGPVDEFGGLDTEEEMTLVATSLADQVRWLRNHPSVFVWVLASDMLPRPALEQKYYDQLSEVDPTRPLLSTCAVRVSEVSGPSGVKMNGPYDWVSPDYWYVDRERGGAYGFNTETGPGPQPPPLASMQRMLPEESWWPPDEMWDYHSGRGQFDTIDRYEEALNERYGEPESLEEFARVAQVANYEGMRAMFESFSIRRPVTTGIIQWMLNSAWPELYWQLYDYYLVPNGAFYGARDASRPINIAFDYADRGIVVVNDTEELLAGVTARFKVLDLDSKVLVEEARTVDVAAGSIERLMTVPEIAKATGSAYFVDARLLDAEGKDIVSSLYWLSTQPDVLDWENSEWFVTPMTQYADLTGLARMPKVEIEVTHELAATPEGYEIDATLSNPSDKLAFFVELRLEGADSGRLAAPVLWSDNYVSLLPGEMMTVHGSIPPHALGGEEPVLRYSGINVLGE
jgi:exo-1,4-beta-D-glucosaminidase